MAMSYELKDTDCFPNYITHSVALGFTTGRNHFGSNFSYLTTGGRLHRADYSGSLTLDMILNGYRIGAFYRQYIYTGLSTLNIYLQIGPGILFSNLKIEEQLNIYSESAQTTTEMKGVEIYIEPTIGATYRFKNWLHFSLGGGYEADDQNRLKLSGQGTDIKANWNGFRLYGGLIFILPTGKKSLNE